MAQEARWHQVYGTALWVLAVSGAVVAVFTYQDRQLVVRTAEGVRVGAAPLVGAVRAPEGSLCVPGEATVTVPLGQDASCHGGHIGSVRVLDHTNYPRRMGGLDASVLLILCVCPEEDGQEVIP